MWHLVCGERQKRRIYIYIYIYIYGRLEHFLQMGDSLFWLAAKGLRLFSLNAFCWIKCNSALLVTFLDGAGSRCIKAINVDVT